MGLTIDLCMVAEEEKIGDDICYVSVDGLLRSTNGIDFLHSFKKYITKRYVNYYDPQTWTFMNGCSYDESRDAVITGINNFLEDPVLEIDVREKTFKAKESEIPQFSILEYAIPYFEIKSLGKNSMIDNRFFNLKEFKECWGPENVYDIFITEENYEKFKKYYKEPDRLPKNLKKYEFIRILF